MKLDIEKETAALQRMRTGQLCERYAELYGEPTRSRHRFYVLRKILWKLQSIVDGDLSDRARRRAQELAKGSELRVMPPPERDIKSAHSITTNVQASSDPRLPAPGTAIVRNYKGQSHRVHVTTDGFEYEGERYRSLSAVAKAITGSHVNGFRFFGLEGKS